MKIKSLLLDYTFTKILHDIDKISIFIFIFLKTKHAKFLNSKLRFDC